MADDKTKQKIKNARAQEIKDLAEVRTKIQNAQRFSELLALGELTPEEKLALQYAQNFEEFSRILGPRHIEEQHELWEAREDWWAYRNIPPPQEPPTQQQTRAGGLPGASTGAGLAVGAGLGLASKLRPERYEDFKKNSHDYAMKRADEWEKAERKKPGLSPYKTKQEAYEASQKYMHDNLALAHEDRAKKWAKEHGDSKLLDALDRKKIQYEVRNKKWTYQNYKDTVRGYAQRAASEWDKDPARSVGRQQTYARAEREMHDLFATSNLSKDRAKKWAKEHNDSDLIGAIERKRLADEHVKNQSLLRRTYRRVRRQPAPVAAGATAATAWSTLPQNTLPGTSAPNTLGGTGAPNILRGAQAPTQAPRAPGIRGRLGSFGSRIGKARQRINNILNPIGYLTRLFKKSLIGSLVSAIGGVVSTIVAGTITLFTTTIAAISVLIGGISGLFGGISIGAIVAAIVALILIPGIIILVFLGVIGFFFPPSSTGEPPEVSPYNGMTYSKGCVNCTLDESGSWRVQNRENATFQIILTHNPQEADCAIEDITLVDDIPPRTTLVEGSDLSTGKYTFADGFVRWKLSENLTSSSAEGENNFTFKLTIDPQDDIKITNRIFIEGCDASAPSDTDLFAGADSAPTTNTCFGKYRDIMTAIKNDFGVSAANFGDPVCSYTNSRLRQVIEQVETNSANVDFWMDIAECESPGNGPNGYGRSSGTWGHFQMDRSYPDPFKPWDPSKNTKGDIPWQRQVQNAVDYNNNVINGSFEYWGTARCLCYYDKYKNEPYCAKLWAKQRVCPPGSGCDYIRTPSQCNNSCTANKGS